MLTGLRLAFTPKARLGAALSLSLCAFSAGAHQAVQQVQTTLGAQLPLVQAGQAPVLGLFEVWQLGLNQDPSYRAAQSRYAATQTQSTISRAGLLPQVQASFQKSRVHGWRERPGMFGITQRSDLRYDSTNYYAQLNQPLINYPRYAEYRRGQAVAALGSAQFAANQQRIGLTIAQSYFNTILAYEDWQMQRSRVAFLSQRVQSFEQLRAYAASTEVELAETKARLALAQGDVLQAADELRTNARQLQAHIGQRPQTLRGISRHWQYQPLQASLEELLLTAHAQNREIQAAEQNVAAYEARYDAAVSQYFPTLDLVMSAGKADSEDLASLSQRSNTFAVGVSMRIPIFTGGFSEDLGAGFANASTPLQLSALATAQANLRSNVEVEKANLKPAEQSAVIKFAKAKAELNAAAEKMANANINASAQVDTALVQNGLSSTTPAEITFKAFTVAAPTAANLEFAASITGLTNKVTVTIVDGKPVLTAAAATDAAKKADIAIVKGLKGYSDLVASLTAVDTAGKNSDKAVDALVTAGEKLNELETGTIAFGAGFVDADTLKGTIKAADTVALFNAEAAKIDAVNFNASPAAGSLAERAKALAEAQEKLSKFDIQSTAFKDAAEESIKVAAAQEDTKAALKVLTEDFDVNPIIVEGKDAQVVGSNEDDLFVYTDTANNAEVDFFNETGDDLFFFGSQFTFVELAAGDEMGKGNLGSKDVLELFAQQVGDNVVLYVELDEVGGTALGLDNVNKITLTGVNLDELDFQGGFLGMKAAEVVA